MLKKRFFKTKDEVEVTFAFQGTDVSQAALVCEANNWQPLPMKPARKEGTFVTRMRLPKNGRFQFRYLLDGERWENDAEADATWPNEHGSSNSVVFTSN